MAERTGSGYKRLFEIQLFHHYWLDDGATLYDLIADQRIRNNHLRTYDVRTLLSIMPTAVTAKELKGLRCFCKDTALGCVVAMPDQGVIPIDAVFTFVVTVQDPAFSNYTVLSLRQQKIYELYNKPDDTTYRYKENVPVLSNLTGVARNLAGNKTLFLSKEYPASGDQAESLVLSGDVLMQMKGDRLGAGTMQITTQATRLPVFLHQGDVPVIAPPAGLVGAPTRGILLTDDIPNSVFALIRVAAVREDDGDFSIVDKSGKAKEPSPIYQVRFKNRATIWKYLDKNTGSMISSESQPLPLTYYGNAGQKQKPSEGVVKVLKPGDHVTQIFSEIYV